MADVLYVDPSWAAELDYYSYSSTVNSAHKDFSNKCKALVNTEFRPYSEDWIRNNSIPRWAHTVLGGNGLIAVAVGYDAHTVFCEIAEQLGLTRAVSKNFDYVYSQLLQDAVGSLGSGGLCWGLFEGAQIGLPPVVAEFRNSGKFADVVGECLLGTKIIALCITEPTAGSDVSGIKATAKENADGWILNGEKKWITNGTFADYFTVAAKTKSGVSLFLVDRYARGVRVTPLLVQGMKGSGTAFVEFDSVQLSGDAIIGKEGEGFMLIMKNFNHERWGMACQVLSLCREMCRDSLKHLQRRKTFGKLLGEHPVLRGKFAEMIGLLHSLEYWVLSVSVRFTSRATQNATCTGVDWKSVISKESIEQLNNVKRYNWSYDDNLPSSVAIKQENNRDLAEKAFGGEVALLKVHATRVMERIAREAAQIYGGAGYTLSGVGSRVERMYRDVRGYAVPGGSEEVLADFASRQCLRLNSRL